MCVLWFDGGINIFIYNLRGWDSFGSGVNLQNQIQLQKYGGKKLKSKTSLQSLEKLFENIFISINTKLEFKVLQGMQKLSDAPCN